MTKTQIWLAGFLVLFILLFLLARITKDDDTSSSSEVTSPVPQTGMTSEGTTAVDLIRRNGCMTCHGPELQGTPMAPPLKNLAQYWNRDNLVSYLRNPSSFMDSDRFKKYKEEYPGTIMPPFNNVDVKDLGKIADYLLTK